MSAQPAFDPPIVGSARAVSDLRAWIVRVASSPATVLIRGESGTGKELVARNIHRFSDRSSRPFVAVNCAALNPGVLESELFGHGRGAFTGAERAHSGLFEQANGGSLFLDEVGEVPVTVQAKLLRVLQEREVRPMGASGARRVDVRVIAATNVDLDEHVRNGCFRLDLFYRLAVLEIDVPPLRERSQDIAALIDHFFAARGRDAPRVTDESWSLLRRYPWPGNVRELENELERVVALHPGVRIIAPDLLSRRVRRGPEADGFDMRILCEPPLPRAVGYLEESLLRRTLAETNWNKSACARQLGLSRQGLLKKIRRYGIRDDRRRPGGE